MSSSDLPTDETAQGTASRRSLLLAALTAAIFLSAALLFAVQPMFTKMVIPRLGGAPAVWSVAMVFFQAALLAGYGYAHLLTRYAPGRTSVIIHLAVMTAACLFLPLAIANGWGRPPAVGEAFWLIGLFAVSIGLPFFALAANSPLLQAWFARTDHPAAKDPYFLYAASNVGSFLALLSYPAVIEPLIRLGDQTRLWSIGFIVLILLLAGCGVLLWRFPGQPAAATAAAAEAAPPTWRDAVTWMALAAVPAGLLVAVTAHISTDVAAVPLLWVLPLALYLVTFVIVFQRRPLIPHWLVVAVQPLFVFGLLVMTLFDVFETIVAVIAAHIAVFFVCALMCHGELARRRPAARDLTSFYMWMSAGGMIGGIAAALAAPHVFNWVAEYPILIALAVLCRSLMPRPRAQVAHLLQAVVIVGGLAVAIGGGVAILAAWNVAVGPLGASMALLVALTMLGWWIARRPRELTEPAFQAIAIVGGMAIVLAWNIVLGILLTLTALLWRVPLSYAAAIALSLMANHYGAGLAAATAIVAVGALTALGALMALSGRRQLARAATSVATLAVLAAYALLTDLRLPKQDDPVFVRSFFGVHKISETADGRFRLLTHGTTIHGVQRIRDADGKPVGGGTDPVGYYYEGAPIVQAIEVVRDRAATPIRLGLIGLGAGGLACRARPQDFAQYYELDPVVIELARDPKRFNFLSDCRPDVPVELGDARLTFADAPDGGYDVIVVDAFSSDAIPIHLITREAMAIYLQKLAPRGLIVMHISNRHLELASVVAGIASANGLATRVNWGGELRDEDEFRLGGTVAAVARSEEDFGPLVESEYWQLQEPDPEQWVWTDDYSNIVGALLRALRE